MSEPCNYFNIFERSGWKVEMFGPKGGFVIYPKKGDVPNWFWRWMQYLAFGNKWTKEKK